MTAKIMRQIPANPSSISEVFLIYLILFVTVLIIVANSVCLFKKIYLKLKIRAAGDFQNSYNF